MTEEQNVKFACVLAQARGTWPPLTDDPEINYEVDRHLGDEDPPLPPWNDADKATKAMYREEASFAHNTR